MFMYGQWANLRIAGVVGMAVTSRSEDSQAHNIPGKGAVVGSIHATDHLRGSSSFHTKSDNVFPTCKCSLSFIILEMLHIQFSRYYAVLPV